MADFQQNAFNAINQGFNFGQQVKAVQDQKRINQLASQGYGAPQQDRQGLLGQIAQVDARAAQQQEQAFANSDERRNTTLANMARILTSAPDQARPGLYQQMLPTLSSFGMSDLPQEYNAETAPIINQAADSIASAYGGGGSGVQSTYINRQGQRVAVMRDGSQQVLGEADARTQLRDQPGVAPSLINLRTAEATPLQAGQIQQQGANGAYTIDPTLPPEVQAQIRAAESAGVDYNGVNPGIIQARPDPSQMITPYQQAQLEISNRTAQRADAAANTATEIQQQARQEKQAQQRSAIEGAVASYDDALATIRKLRSHPGYESLGTIQGDVALNTPLVRTDAKGANAALETVKSQSLINTLSALKAASATGASGFGSLTEKEGAALQAAIANLSTAQSHEDLDSNLAEIERVMTRNRRMAMQKASSLSGGNNLQTTQTVVDGPNGIIRVTTRADYDALPSGATYLDPQGNQRRKR